MSGQNILTDAILRPDEVCSMDDNGVTVEI